MITGELKRQDDLSEYLRAKEPGKAELAGIWRAAILLVGLHDEPESLVPSAREQVGEQVGEQVREQVTNALPKGVVLLLKVLKGEMSVLDMMMVPRDAWVRGAC